MQRGGEKVVAISRMSLRSFLANSDLRSRYVAAVLKMKGDGIYQIFVDWHADRAVGAVAHDNVSFLAWHRIYIRLFEIELQKADEALQTAADPSFNADNVISLPWWDYPNMDSPKPNKARGRMWRDDFLGPTGTGSNMTVPTGPFRANHEWPIQRRAGFDPDLSATPFSYETRPPGHLTRRLARSGTRLPSTDEIDHTVNRIATFDNNYFSSFLTGSGQRPEGSDRKSFRAVLEGFAKTGAVKSKKESQMHNGTHVWVGGMMGFTPPAPNDPVFWLHHCNIDRLWAQWQIRHPSLVDQWPSNTQIETARSTPGPTGGTNPNATKLDDRQIPWNASAKPWTKDDGTLLFTTEIYRARDVLNWTSMGPNLGGYQITGVNSLGITF